MSYPVPGIVLRTTQLAEPGCCTNLAVRNTDFLPTSDALDIEYLYVFEKPLYVLVRAFYTAVLPYHGINLACCIDSGILGGVILNPRIRHENRKLEIRRQARWVYVD